MSTPYRPQVKQTMPLSQKIAALLFGLILFGFALYFITKSGTTSTTIQNKLGADGLFQAGASKSLSKEIAARGPVIYPDLLQHQRGANIYIQHIGTDANTGWYAFAVRQPDQPANCQAVWNASSSTFTDNCSGRTYPKNGDGLPSYRVEVKNGYVVVDLQQTK